MRQTIMLMAACAALLASCTNEVGEGLGIDTPIQVTASVEGIMTTRAENTEGNLDNFGLSIKDGTGYTGDYAGENIKVTGNNTDGWTFSDNKTVLYKGGGQSYYAYAPYKEGHTGESLTFTVDADQSAEGAMQASDLLHASGKVESAKLDITLAHKLSKLTVTVTKKGETTPIEVGDVTLRGTKPTTTLALVDGDSGVKAGDLGEASGTETSEIKMWHNTTGGTYECILVPQATAFDVSFTYGGDTYLWESSSFTFEGGNAYTLALTFDGKVSAGEVTVSGWGEPEKDLGEGTATEKDYTYDEASNTYTVYTAEGLLAWREAATSGSEAINCTLAADINMTGQTLPSIGGYNLGMFDGNGHTITGLNDCLISSNEGTVRNLTLVEPDIESTYMHVGAITGANKNIIENCHVVGGTVKGFSSNTGGIAGINNSNDRIYACSSTAEVTHQSSDLGAGGIAGCNLGTILACYATGNVTGGIYVSVGAIAGYQRDNGTITACYWSGTAEKGVGNGNGSADGTTKVEGNDWTAAMNTMNTALSGTGYRWIENTGENKEDRPLIITNE